MGIRSLIQRMHLEWRSDSSSLTAFHYDPLPEPKNYIRLLELLPSNDGVISCRLTQWLVSEAPLYCAISYTWGDTLDTTRIHVNGQEVIVRKNCEYALRQAQGQRGDRYLWVDSICINQTDDDEKGHQVAMMGDIFSRATSGLALARTTARANGCWLSADDMPDF
ncbi:uncharacterized protein E0L32_011936 [Thyridium curvatum]|uniref:Heterokaryon incompatibility domain-containing protein n=1 Tax=Thyridium curvatum TaxID=1093900 RepID=A0A507BKK0_9PEZI|nr:uncharacterized protein E0L32_011936 [Thyridium curvatum]TPX17989.1 hypothetical protein E0L32_011936 [Thyridium curvatum]